MAKKKDDGFFYLIGIIGLLVLSVFIINTVCVYNHYNKKYVFSEASARVTDTWNFIRFMPIAIVLGVVTAYCIPQVLGLISKEHNYIGAALLILGWIIIIGLPALLLTARMGTTQAGLLIYKNRGYFVIPTDWNKNTFVENIFQLEIIKAMYDMEALNLADIDKITRESGKIAYIHGTFGTRKIAWRNKEKRDECIAALERGCGKRLVSR